MASTQQVLVTLFAINLILGMITQMYIDVDTFNQNVIDNELTYQQNLETGFEDEEGLYTGLTNENYQEQQTIGNKLKWSSILLKGAFRGIVPIYPAEYTPSSEIEQILKNGFTLLRVFMYLLVALEVYMFFVNRKTS